MVQNARRISRSELAGQLDAVLDAVHGGVPAIVEQDGRPEATILDVVDYRLLRAAARATGSQKRVDVEDELSDERLAALADEQERYDLILRYYLADGLSTGRLAELLNLPWVDVRARFSRLGLPFFSGPESVDELTEEVRSARAWLRRS